MGLFWKRGKKHGLSVRQERVARRFAVGIVRVQTNCADYLNRKTQYWNRASKLILLALLILLLGGFSLYQLIRSFIY